MSMTIAEKQAKIAELEKEILEALPELGVEIRNEVKAFLNTIKIKYKVLIYMDTLRFYHNQKAYEDNDYFLNFNYE
jgi:hypothetical protein